MPRSCRLFRAKALTLPPVMLIITPLTRPGMSPRIGGVLVEVVVHDRRALRGGQHARPQADQAAGGDRELQVHLAVAVVHPDQLALAVADQLHHAAHVLLGHVDDQVLDRLQRACRLSSFCMITCGLPTASSYPSRRMFSIRMPRCSRPRPETLNASLLLGSPRPSARRWLCSSFDQPLAEVAAGDVLALLAGERRVVDAEHHGQRRRLDLLGLQRLRVERSRRWCRRCRPLSRPISATMSPAAASLGFLRPKPSNTWSCGTLLFTLRAVALDDRRPAGRS